ncbi:MAG: DUF3488 and transglutaminase-like domain-containing protein [Nocardioidaceae bacterium]
MTGRRGAFGTALLQALVGTLTAFVTLLSWRGFSMHSATYLAPCFLGALLIAAVGSALRWSRLAAPLVVLAQVVVVTMFGCLVISGSPVPWGERWTELTTAVRDAVDATQAYAAPVPTSAASIAPLMLPLALVLVLLVDVFAGTMRRVPLAGLSLLTIYSIPVSLLTDGVSWWVFVLAAGGFLTMLFLFEDEQVARWGRPMGQSEAQADPAAFGVRTGAIKTTAFGIGGAATAAALLLPALVPTLDLGVFTGGTGSGNGDVHIENPITDLRRDLQLGRDEPLLRLVTDDPAPAYLRISALTTFTGTEWRAGNREIPSNHTPSGPLPPPEGVSSTVEGRAFDYQVSVLDSFDSTWLPTMVPATSVTAAGDWRYDDATMDFLAMEGTDTRGLDYRLTAERLDLLPASMAAAPNATGRIQDRFTDLPEGLPFEVKQIADQVTAGQPSKFQKATALQDWFRKEGGFTYDIRSAPSGNGADALVEFLDGKVGYCEQYASAMAVMARVEGIPARVAVGFLRPDRLGPNSWEYSSHDLHAWVEAYFPGSGWVLFDPTPSSVSGAAPSYTRAELPGSPELPSVSAPTDTGNAEALPTRGSSAPAGAQRDQSSADGASDSGGFPWLAVLGGLVGVLVVALLAMAPRTVRRLRSDRRWAAWNEPEAAWAELHDTMLDLGHPWPTGLSPRAAGAQVARHFGLPEDEQTADRPRHGVGVYPVAELALERIVRAVELLRYAAPGSASTDGLRTEVETCVSSLVGGAPTAARRRARWLPRSVLRNRRRPLPTGSVEVVGHGGLVDHVG